MNYMTTNYTYLTLTLIPCGTDLESARASVWLQTLFALVFQYTH